MEYSPKQIHEVLVFVYNALQERGYNPTAQLTGYLLSGDPTYITNYNSARSLITSVDRDSILEFLIDSYVRRKMP